jgi:hypothetical protein
MKSRPDTHAMAPEEVALLQECFDTLQQTQRFDRKGPDADAVATALVLAYQRGIRDKDDLLKLARL